MTEEEIELIKQQILSIRQRQDDLNAHWCQMRNDVFQDPLNMSHVMEYLGALSGFMCETIQIQNRIILDILDGLEEE